MLNRLITLVIVLAIAYFLLSRAGPWIRDRFQPAASPGESSASAEASDCIDRASEANNALGRAARQFGRPPADLDAWSDTFWEIESTIQTAASACSCGSQACRSGSQAVGEIRALLSTLDELVRGDARGVGNPARQQERINRLLDEARASVGH